MIDEAAARPPSSSRGERYRQAEQRLWEHFGLQPRERFLELDRPPLRLRVLEVGSGSPTLFLPGSGGSGAGWAPLLAELDGFRCLLLDPPNSGLSSRLDYTGRRYGDAIVEVLRGVVDGLGLERVDVVGFSIGNVSALRLAEAEPDRVGRVALLGAGPLPEGYRVPGVLRAIASPLGALMVRLPPGRRSTRAFLSQLGHSRSLRAGHIPDEMIDWHIAFDRHTDTLRNERAMVRALTDWRRGSLRPGVTFTAAELRRIAQPTLLVYGGDDRTGSLDDLRPVIEALPRGELRVVDGCGHMLWLDDPAAVAAAIVGFLTSIERGDEMIDEYRQTVLAIAEAIAPGWERRRAFIEETAAPVRDWLVDALAPQPGETVLELAAGAGDVGFTAADRLGETGRLITTDVSPAMLNIARRRGAELDLANVEYRVMDAQQIELEDDSVDGILCRFGYMLLPDPQAALAEARRVLRPGGRLSLAVWGPPERNPFFSLIGMALVRGGHLPPPDPAEPGIFTLADPGRIHALLEGAGFADIQVEDVTGAFEVAGIDEYLAVIADTAGPLGLALRDLDADERSSIADELRQSFSEFAAPDGYRVPALARAACAS